ncbi:hypothetical protein B0T13DRAFT_486088 [Neurospora crassa]|nr:hypothetical protein B0T13DRAFT_492305 [Neurospora crassa]KAK3505493.1 hypothetical protein B0T13DRAFT_486088 [Neurospora crassa]
MYLLYSWVESTTSTIASVEKGLYGLARRRGTYAHYTGPNRCFGVRLCPEARTPENLQGSLRANTASHSGTSLTPVRNDDRDRVQKRPLLDADHIQ